jgi:septal ring factor EnvC (AmiA/AmiB activator)
MAEPAKPFWYLAGVGVIFIAGAVGWRILNPNQGVTVDGAGLSVTLGSVQQNITEAQQSVGAATAQITSQRAEIEQLEKQLAGDQARIRALLEQIERTPQASASLRSLATTMRNEQASAPPAPITRIDPSLLVTAQQRLVTAQKLTAELKAFKR